MRRPRVLVAVLVVVLGALSGCGRDESGCRSDSDCDDLNPCTKDVCSDAACRHEADDNATPAETSTDPCKRAVCRSGRQMLVLDDTLQPDDGVACTRDSCVRGLPQHTPDPSSCGEAPACRQFTCDPTAGCVLVTDVRHPADDGKSCTFDRCDGATPVAVPQDIACHERPAGAATCLALKCVPSADGADASGCALVPDDGACDDHDGCTEDRCDPSAAGADAVSGCTHRGISGTPAPVPGNCREERCESGVSADVPDLTDLPPDADGLPCTVPSCEGGVPHEVPDDARCDDGLSCTSDSCRAGQGCVHAPIAGSCGAGTSCDPSAASGSGCVDADTCPPRLVAVPDLLIAQDTTGVRDDFSPSCAENAGHHPDLAFDLAVAARSDLHAEVRASDGRRVALALVEIADGACGRELMCAHGAPGTELDLVDVPPGRYALVVDGDGPTAVAGPFELLATLSPTGIAEGALLITELMPDPSAVDDTAGEYVEFGNAGTVAVTTAGLQLSKDGGTTNAALSPANPWRIVAPGQYLVAARKVDANLNGGIEAAFVLPFGLANTPSEQLVLSKAGGPVLDTVDLKSAPFPRATAGRSFQLDPGHLDAADDDAYANWCTTQASQYGAGDHGTPGAANERCHPECTSDAGCDDHLPCTADHCVAGACTHANDDALVPPDDGLSCTTSRCVSGAVVTDLHDDLCDDTVGCTRDTCVGAGGASGTGCAHAPDDALCRTGEACDASRGCFVPPVPGDSCAGALVLASAADVSLDAMSDDVALSCGVGSAPDAFLRVDLSADGHLALAATGSGSHALALFAGNCGQLRELACATDALEVRGLAAGTYYVAVEGSAAVHVTATATAGELAAGELVISEIMMDPATPLDDASAEYIELANPKPYAVATGSLRLVVGSGTAVALVEPGTVRPFTVAPGGYLLAARKSDPALNGGLHPDFLFTASLANTGGSIQLKTAAGTLVDAVTYASHANGFPTITAGRAFNLDPAAFREDLNDLGASWCLAQPAAPTNVSAYDPGGQNYGTPRQPNPRCAP